MAYVKPKTDAEKLMRIYDLLREAHASVKQIWKEFPDLVDSDPFGDYAWWENSVDAVDHTLYLAEGFFVEQERRAMSKREKG